MAALAAISSQNLFPNPSSSSSTFSIPYPSRSSRNYIQIKSSSSAVSKSCPSRLSLNSKITSGSISCAVTKQSTHLTGEETAAGNDAPGVLLRPDSLGRFGKFGGKHVPETLMHALTELESAFRALATDSDFQEELDGILKDYVGRESPLYSAERLTEHYKRANGEGPDIYLKREDLNHTGAHKINNAMAQALLAKKLGKERIIAETGAGQHGVATATVCARLGLQCVIYMGAQDMERQALNVFRMKLLGAEVRAVHSGTATLKDATSEAIRDWVTNVETTHYILGSVAGPHPYPMMVREFHAVIGKETRKQALEKWGGKPDVLVACVGGGSNAMGLFHEFVDDKDIRLTGVEAAGFGVDSGKHAATLTLGEVGVLHGAMSYLLQDDDGQIIEPHSISAGLDYPGVGPEHSFLKDLGHTECYRSGMYAEVRQNYTCTASESGLCTSSGRFMPEMYHQLTGVVSISHTIRYYAPPLLSHQDSNFIGETFTIITSDHCLPLENHLRMVNAGLGLVSAGVMLSLALWIVYANRQLMCSIWQLFSAIRQLFLAIRQFSASR